MVARLLLIFSQKPAGTIGQHPPRLKRFIGYAIHSREVAAGVLPIGRRRTDRFKVANRSL